MGAEDWSFAMRAALVWVPRISSALSLLGSSWIVAEVIGDEKKNINQGKNVYSRLLLGMSVYDILESIWNLATTWPVPAGTPDIIGASGTVQTCTVQGFFLQFGLGVPIYNACLSVYYLLMIKYNMTEHQLRRRVEPAMHIVAFCLAMGTALTGIVLKQYNEANLWCWLAPYPRGCLDSMRYGDEATCTRGNNAWFWRIVLYYTPLWTCITVAFFTMMAVYAAVKRSDKKSLQYRKPQVRFGEATEIEAEHHRRQSNLFVEPSLRNTSRIRYEDESSMDIVDLGDEEEADQEAEEKEEDELSNRPPTHRRTPSTGSSVSAPTTAGKASLDGSDSQRSKTSLSVMIRKWRQSRLESTRDFQRSQDVFHQSMWYLGAFLWTHLFSTTNRGVQWATGQTFYALVFLNSVFDPLQGFLNFLVYRRPRYLRYRRSHPERSRLWAAYRTLKRTTTTPLWVKRESSRLSGILPTDVQRIIRRFSGISDLGESRIEDDKDGFDEVDDDSFDQAQPLERLQSEIQRIPEESST